MQRGRLKQCGPRRPASEQISTSSQPGARRAPNALCRRSHGCKGARDRLCNVRFKEVAVLSAEALMAASSQLTAARWASCQVPTVLLLRVCSGVSFCVELPTGNGVRTCRRTPRRFLPMAEGPHWVSEQASGLQTGLRMGDFPATTASQSYKMNATCAGACQAEEATKQCKHGKGFLAIS